MLGREKMPPINSINKIQIVVFVPGKDLLSFQMPDTAKARQNIQHFLHTQAIPSQKEAITPWDKATPWEEVAKERIDRYTEAGLALRGARYREGLTQKALARRCHISQENLSKMENGTRVIGAKVAKKLAKALHVHPSLFSPA